MPEHNLDENGFVIDNDAENRAHLAAIAIANCELCDDDGYRGTLVCDHADHAAAAKRGMAKVRAALGKDGDA
ncbi:hypothetical protein SEA_PIPER2020_90 [Mycobacterium phage Piper2020]|nr:hypothetical protein SEA_PIPER2020_90 [Mycobacterium phage Piper2020]